MPGGVVHGDERGGHERVGVTRQPGHLRGRRLRLRAGLAAVAVLAGACAAQPPAAQGLRAQLLGALPPEAAARGVYLYEPGEAGDLSPQSLVQPVLGFLADDVELVAETAAPPLTLLGGVGADQPLPPGAERVGEIVVIGQPDEVEAARARLESRTAPAGLLAELAAVDAQVGWAGPLPAYRGARPEEPGELVLALDAAQAVFSVSGPGSLQAWAGAIRRNLAGGSVPGSPGKPWRELFTDAEVESSRRRVVVRAVPAGLEGRMLRGLLDGQALTFLAP